MDEGSDTESPEEEFKKAVKDYVLLTDQIAEIRAVINEKNKVKKRLTEFIISFMKEKDKEICNLCESGLLQMKKCKTSLSLRLNIFLLINKAKQHTNYKEIQINLFKNYI